MGCWSEVVSVDPNSADTEVSPPKLTQPPVKFQQTITFRAIKTLKGSYRVGEAISLIIPVTTVCFGLGCVFSFKIGDITLVLAPSSAPSFIEGGCWMYEGVAMRSILWVPTVSRP
jgi:hypothetical protein